MPTSGLPGQSVETKFNADVAKYSCLFSYVVAGSGSVVRMNVSPFAQPLTQASLERNVTTLRMLGRRPC